MGDYTPPAEGSKEVPNSPEDLLRELGVRNCEYAPAGEAPPVDVGLLRAVVNLEVGEEDVRRVLRLVATFRSWEEGYGRVLRESLGGKER